MSFILYRRPRSLSLKGSKQALSFDCRFTTSNTVPEAAEPSEPLLRFEALPEWLQDNPYVHGGYRAVNNSYSKCFRSYNHIHNESLNILTHLVPALGLVFSQYYLQQAITHYYPEATLMDRTVFGLNVLAAIVTFTLSTLYHTFMCHSRLVSTRWLRIDYLGILTLILGSFFSGIYVGFYNDSVKRNLYWSMIASLSVVTAIFVVHPDLQGPKYRKGKAYAFIATALTGFAPITHGLYLYGWDYMWVRSGMPFWFLEGLIYLIGAVFFITRFPESAWPGYFDIYFNSHSIFHTLVVMASFAHMYGVWSAYDWNYQHLGMCAVAF